MGIYIALLQGVNIGKNKRIAMVDFKQILAELGGSHITTIANSGNAVFDYAGELTSDQLRGEIEQVVTTHVGITIPTILRTSAEIVEIIERNPYPDAAQDTKTLHVDFLDTDVAGALEGIDQGQDSLTQIGREIYLYAPNKLSGATYDSRALNKRLGSHHTSRNWNTVQNLRTACDMVQHKL